MKKNILMLPGDGIGPEIIAEARKIVLCINERTDLNLEITEREIGGSSYDIHKKPITAEVLSIAKKADAILLGSVGGAKWETIPFNLRPERALLALRKELKLFANLRPAIVFDPLINASTLKPEVVSKLDIMIVRELTGGIYFGKPRGIKKISSGKSKGINSLVYETYEIERIAKIAFELAKKRKGIVCSVDKANVLESTLLWRDVVSKTHKKYKDVKLTHMYVDNAAMQLIRNPKQFDVIVTTNMFGDILSDAASMLTGSLGMLPSASLGSKSKSGKQNAMYEPIHGSAPDIAGGNVANPLATILSVAMMMRYSFNKNNIAKIIEKAVHKTLNKGYRTADIMQKGMKRISTSRMGDVVLKELIHLI
jgi:3-isopropylmalate dehydrogenase|tara:strand:+ start:1832 stop:2932 length:1101 start_codon:yes stop_codon:yes gene_type:complete